MSHRQLKVSNFQLSMPHVTGCPRQGMPLQAVAVRLPKSELKFVLERIEQCPIPPSISLGPVYRKRQLASPSDTNQLHQIYIRLLTTIIKTFDSRSLKAIEPLKQIALILSKPDALRLFQDWAPPSSAPTTHLIPTQAFATAQFDDQHDASQVLELSSTFWKSLSMAQDATVEVGVMFDPPVPIAAISVHWHASYLCHSYTVLVSSDGGKAYDTVAIILNPITDQRLVLPTATTATHVKIVMTQTTESSHFGLHALRTYATPTEVLYTPPNQLLEDLLTWVATAATASPHATVRCLARSILQKLALVSGSLCALLYLVQCLFNTTDDALDSDETLKFLTELSLTIQRVMMQSTTDTTKIEKRIIHQMSLSLQDEVTRRTIQILQNIPGLEVYSPAPANAPLSDAPVQSHPPLESPETATSAPVVVLLVSQPSFVKCIQSHVQLAMVLLAILGELSVWQMHRMQRPEEFVGRREDELSRLEDPFSIQVCPNIFDLCSSLLRALLAPWLDPASTTLYDRMTDATSQFTRSLSTTTPSTDCKFTPTTMALTILQILTCNVRRLVLSRVNPAEAGLDNGSQDPMLQSLEHLISLGTKRTDALFPLSLQAAAAIEVGMEAFYPSAQQRTHLLTTRMGLGATLEFQLRWPVQERDQEDPRYERLILLLQLACIQRRFDHALRGTWGVFLHLVVALPPNESTASVLQQAIAECIQQAGFAAWQVVAGAQEISITLQRHLHWNRIEKMSHDSGSGWIRVYPRAVASYDEVLTEVDSFVDQHASLTI
ncbi:unnamed protein product [Aphanomyces euteiches]